MPTDLARQLQRCGHARRDGLWAPSELQKVHQEALALWQALRSGQRGEQLGRTGADPHGCELRLSPRHPHIWALLTRGALPRLVAEASGWSGFRPLHFGLLCKQPGAAMTGWHRDKDVIPSDAPILTCWIPLTPVQAGSGLHYAEGTAALSAADGSLADGGPLQQLLLRHGMPFVDTTAFEPGDVDLHDGKVWHCGLPNRMTHQRLALAACYIPADARLNPSPAGFDPPRGAALRQRIRELYFPQLQPGELLQGDAHPLLRAS